MTHLGSSKCPYLEEPFDDCYVKNLGSQSIRKAIYYCAENFRECEIFKRHSLHSETDSFGEVEKL